MGATAELTGYSRVWLIRGGAGPSNPPRYQGYAKAGSPDWSMGDITRIEAPSPDQFGKFIEVGTIRGADERPTLGLTFLYTNNASEVLSIAQTGCALDVQIHFGRCEQPNSYRSWEKILIFENALITNWSTGDLGALEQGENAKIDEEVELTAEWFYEVVKMSYALRGGDDIAQEVIAVAVDKGVSCGDCDRESDGCSNVFAVSAPAGSSPGVKAEVIFSDDGFTTSGDTWIDTMEIGEDPDDAAVVGTNLVVVSEDTESLHYASITDILLGQEEWNEVTDGFEPSHGPRAITTVGASDTWIAGAGGYIYYSSDITNGVETQDEGESTAEDLNDIAAYDTDVVVAVGNANTVLYTLDGATWTSVTGPDTVNTPNLVSVAVRDRLEWWVGTNDNAMWVTENGGVTWTQARFTGDTQSGGGTGTVNDIQFASGSVGFMAHETSASRGRILRTTDGGRTWIVAPEIGTFPLVDRINSIATCYREVNRIYAGGLADNAADGALLVGVRT